MSVTVPDTEPSCPHAIGVVRVRGISGKKKGRPGFPGRPEWAFTSGVSLPDVPMAVATAQTSPRGDKPYFFFAFTFGAAALRFSSIAAWAAARRATGTRYGEQLT